MKGLVLFGSQNDKIYFEELLTKLRPVCDITFEVLSAHRDHEKLRELCKSMKINPENIAYIGDDVNDIDIIKLVGLSASPNDAVYQVKKIVDYICENNGGSGAFREFADMILKEKFPDKTKWY